MSEIKALLAEELRNRVRQRFSHCRLEECCKDGKIHTLRLEVTFQEGEQVGDLINRLK